MEAVQLHEAALGLARPGERILWFGQPRQGLFLRRSDAFVVPFTLVWAGFAVFWTIGATTAGAPLFFTLWGCMFVAVGGYMVVGRFFADAWQRKGTIYVLTDQRLVSQARRKELSTPLTQLGGIECVGHSGGRGTVRHGAAPSRLRFALTEVPAGFPGASRHQRPMLDSISDVQSVYDQLITAVQIRGRPQAG